MAERNARSDVLKKLSDGKTLCSEMNNASSNANFLFLRRHDATVLQLESAKQSLVSQNQRAQNEMKKRLDRYKRRKHSIFRNRVVSQQWDDRTDSETIPSLRTPTRTPSSTGDTRSCLSGTSGGSSVHLPSILSTSMTSSSEDQFHATMNKQHKFHRMKRQECMHYQVLSSKVYEFCAMLDTERNGGNAFFITTAKRRIAFNDARARSRVSSGMSTVPSRVSSGTLAVRGKAFQGSPRVATAVTT